MAGDDTVSTVQTRSAGGGRTRKRLLREGSTSLRASVAWSTLTNCYVIEDADGGTVVDACFPSTGDGVVDLLATLGRTPADIRVLLPTHGHFDHVGFVRGLKATLGTPIWIHRTGAALAAHPYRYRPQRNRLLFSMGHGRSLPILGRMGADGDARRPWSRCRRGLRGRRCAARARAAARQPAPDRTAGQCAFLLPGRVDRSPARLPASTGRALDAASPQPSGGCSVGHRRDPLAHGPQPSPRIHSEERVVVEGRHGQRVHRLKQ